MWPIEWQRFIAENNLIGKEIEIPESDDLTGVGAVIEILSEPNARGEFEELVPGTIARHHGFVPVGACGYGTGDPYFLNLNDRQPGPLYRIDHERVQNLNYDRATSIGTVLNSYTDLLRFERD